MPNQWTVGGAGVAGTDILKGSSPYDGSYDLEFLGDASTFSSVYQTFNSAGRTNSKLVPNGVYAISFRIKSPSVPNAGVLAISLMDGAGTQMTDDAGNNLLYSLTLSGISTSDYVAYTAFFRLPKVLPANGIRLYVRLTTAIQSTKLIHIDHLAMGVATQLYNTSGQATPGIGNPAGGPFVACFSAQRTLSRGIRSRWR